MFLYHLPPPVSAENYAREFFDLLVAFVCLLSLLLCGRSIVRGIFLQHVRQHTKPFLYLCCEGAVLLGDSKISTLHIRFPLMNTIRLCSIYFVDFKHAELDYFSLKTCFNKLQTAPQRKLIIIIIIIILLQFFCFDHSKATRLQSGNLVMKERVAQRNRMTQCQAVVTDNTLMLN